MGFLVGIDPSFAESLESSSAHKSAPSVRAATIVKNLMVHVDRRIPIALQHSLILPIPKESRRPRIAILRFVIAWLLTIEDQSNDVRRMLFVELRLKFRTDYVVRRRDDIAQRTHVSQVVTDTAK
jgi:hypothetical protein